MSVLCLTSAKPAGLFPMQTLTDDDRMTLAADAYALLHYCAGRSVVEIIDRVSVFMDETLRAAAVGRGDRGTPARPLAVHAPSVSSGDRRGEIRCPHRGVTH